MHGRLGFWFGSALVLAVWVMLPAGAVVQAAEGSLGVSGDEPGTWVVTWKGKPICVYQFKEGQKKPYVKELATIGGENILRDAPADHLHHHGLMYAIRINGVNFWEEATEGGVEKPAGVLTREESRDEKGRPRALFRQRIYWLKPQDAGAEDLEAAALLIEDRAIAVTVDEGTDEVLLEWIGDFRVGPAQDRVELHGSNYNGLGVRFPQELDALADHSLSGHRPDVSQKKNEVAAADWGAVRFPRSGGPVTLAMLSCPENERGGGFFFAMKEPFAYLAATQGLDREPLVHKRGDQFRVRYAVLVYPKLLEDREIDSRAREWSKSQPAFRRP